jgi:hypothetical protein
VETAMPNAKQLSTTLFETKPKPGSLFTELYTHGATTNHKNHFHSNNNKIVYQPENFT